MQLQIAYQGVMMKLRVDSSSDQMSLVRFGAWPFGKNQKMAATIRMCIRNNVYLSSYAREKQNSPGKRSHL